MILVKIETWLGAWTASMRINQMCQVQYNTDFVLGFIRIGLWCLLLLFGCVPFAIICCSELVIPVFVR